MNNELQPAFVLHAKPFRESSLICDVLTEQSGLVKVFARKAKYHNPYQVFTQLDLSLKEGKGDLYYIDKLEGEGKTHQFSGMHLYCAYYVNELIVYLAENIIDCRYFFEQYQQTLIAIEQKQKIEPTLRNFEFTLLNEIGMMPDLTMLSEVPTETTSSDLQDTVLYQVVPEIGVVALTSNSIASSPLTVNPIPSTSKTNQIVTFTGRELALIAAQHWQDEFVLKKAKLLMRDLINNALKGKKLNSRKLIQSLSTK